MKALDEHEPASVDLKLRPGDKLDIDVFGEEKLSGPHQIDSFGRVSLPLAGPIKAAGLTRTELERQVASRLADHYLRSPKVSVAMQSSLPFFILGEVEKPGRYDYEGGLDVWRAIALAGGQTYRASSSTVFIQKAGNEEWREVALSPTLKVDPGDLIRVPDRWF